MKAWQIVGKEQLQLIERAQTVQPGQIKVRINKGAISSTDIAMYKGKSGNLPLIPVKNAVGQVSETNELCGLKKGERVVINPYVLDEDAVLDKHKEIVPDVKIMGVDTDGLLCDFAVIPNEKVCYLPEGITDNEAIFVEQIALGIKVLEALKVDKGQYVVILGASTFCNIIAQLAIYYQIIPILVDNDPAGLEKAENNGIYYTINPTLCSVTERVLEITGGEMAEYCVYDARNTMLPSYATGITKEGGTIVIAGSNYFVEGMQLDLGDVLRKQHTVIGIKNGYGEIYSAINLLANKAVNTQNLIDGEISFDDVPKKLKEISDAGENSPYQKFVINC